jgi:hypothetical protein
MEGLVEGEQVEWAGLDRTANWGVLVLLRGMAVPGRLFSVHEKIGHLTVQNGEAPSKLA